MMKTLLASLLCISIVSFLPGQKPRLGLPVGHQDELYQLALSKDGKYLVSAGSKSIKYWDVATGKPLFHNNEFGVTEYLATSDNPDQVDFVIGITDPSFCTWSLSKDTTERIAWDPVGLQDKKTKVQLAFETFYNKTATGDFEYATFNFSPDDTRVLVIGQGNNYQFWDVKAQKMLQKGQHAIHLMEDLKPHLMQRLSPGNFVNSVVFLQNEPVLVHRPEKNSVVLTHIFTNKTISTCSSADVKTLYFSAVVSNDGKNIFLTDQYRIEHWDIASGKMVKKFDMQARFFNTAAPLQPEPNGVTVGMSHGLCTWNFEAGTMTVSKQIQPKPGATPEIPEGSPLARVNATTPDGKFGIDKTYDENTMTNTLTLWDMQRQQKRVAFPNKVLINGDIGESILVSDDEQYLVYAVTQYYELTSHFYLFDLKTGEEIRRFQVENGGLFLSMAFSGDKKWLAYGASDRNIPIGVVECASGKTLHSFNPPNCKVVALGFSADKKWLYAACSDFTLRVYDVASGKELVALAMLGNEDWTVVSPDGLFDASPGAMKSMFYTVGKEVIELEQLKERYYEPGILSKCMGYSLDPVRAVSNLDEVPLYPQMSHRLSADNKVLELTITPRKGGIGKLSVFVNDKEMTEDANPKRATSVTLDLTAYAKFYKETGENTVTLRVYNADGWLKSPAISIQYTPPPTAKGNDAGGSVTPSSLGQNPSLYAVVVGTANYAGDKLDLKFADRDASAFGLALRAVAPNIFQDRVYVTLLNTDAADKTRQDVAAKNTIQAAFAAIAGKAKPQDVLVIYFSGHGVNYGAAEQAQFFYLTKDIASEDLKDPDIRKNYAVSSLEITEWIKSIAALKQVMILDACNSGKIVEDFAGTRKDLNASQIRALDRLKDRTGMFILTGSAADKVSFEAGQFGQGLLTYSLLQGMSGLALTADKRVDVMTLFQYCRDKVPELAKGIGGIQTPVLAFPLTGASFDIGIVDSKVHIPLAQQKPVFIRNLFQDEESFDDVLGLTNALAKNFQDVTARGAQADLIYVDVNEYENAYSIKGRYAIQGDKVEVRGKLFKGKVAVGDGFKVTGQKSDVAGLAAAVLEKVISLLD